MTGTLLEKSAFVPRTEGIKYVGSKLKMLPHILYMVKKTGARTILDGFSGTTRVSQALAKSGHAVIANDIAIWSEVFGKCYLRASSPKKYYDSLIAHLNAVSPRDGWFTKHYGGDANGGRSAATDGIKKPWQRHNTRKLDGIRAEIEEINLRGTDKAVALTSLMLALDKVDNTLGHFASYLGEWAPRAYRPMILKTPDISAANAKHQVMRGDILSSPPPAADLAYYDPPYGSGNEKMPASRVRYASYYHIWKTVALFDSPRLFGRVRRRADSTDTLCASPFEEFRTDNGGRHIAAKAVEELIARANAEWVLLSYSSGGRVTEEELRAAISLHGRLREISATDYRTNVMGGMIKTNEWTTKAKKPHREFLFLIEK